MMNPPVSNMTTTVNLNCTLNLKDLVSRIPDTRFCTKSFSKSLVWKTQNPKGTLRLFENGKVVCLGTTSIENVHAVVEQFASLLKGLGYDANASDFKVSNMVGHYNTGFQIKVEDLYRTYK